MYVFKFKLLTPGTKAMLNLVDVFLGYIKETRSAYQVNIISFAYSLLCNLYFFPFNWPLISTTSLISQLMLSFFRSVIDVQRVPASSSCEKVGRRSEL